MVNSPASSEMETALQAAKLGGGIVAKYFERGVDMRSKSGEAAFNLVSDADVESEQAIAAAIRSQFPNHEILGEEEQQGSIEAEHLWIIDPLDGTNNFAHRIPHFAISVAYYRDGIPQCGVVHNPIRGECYWAERGKGAFEGTRRLRVSPAERLDQAIVGVGFYYDRGAMMQLTLDAIHAFFKQQIHGVRRFGTAALDLCQVADGLFGVFFEYQLAPWDFAAGRLILEEAGGTISDCKGQSLGLKQSSVLASNSNLHASALAIVKQFHP